MPRRPDFQRRLTNESQEILDESDRLTQFIEDRAKYTLSRFARMRRDRQSMGQLNPRLSSVIGTPRRVSGSTKRRSRFLGEGAATVAVDTVLARFFFFTLCFRGGVGGNGGHAWFPFAWCSRIRTCLFFARRLVYGAVRFSTRKGRRKNEMRFPSVRLAGKI